MNRKKLIETIGKSCRRWRLSMGYDIKQICTETGYCPASVSMFEGGKNNNVALFMWYIAHGFNTNTDFISNDEPLKRHSAFDMYVEVSRG